MYLGLENFSLYLASPHPFAYHQSSTDSKLANYVSWDSVGVLEVVIIEFHHKTVTVSTVLDKMLKSC